MSSGRQAKAVAVLTLQGRVKSAARRKNVIEKARTDAGSGGTNDKEFQFLLAVPGD